MPPRQPSILLFIPWFGQWPAWMRFFVESCRANPTIDWVLVSDCGPVDDCPANVRVLQTTLLNYRALISAKLGIDCQWTDAYKICDLRPAIPMIHDDLVAGYDYWGFGDIDVIYGDIRSIYDAGVLSHDIISSHDNQIAGHFTLVRNTDPLNTAFTRVRGWRGLLSRAGHASFDEHYWSHLFTRTRGPSVLQHLRQRLRSPYLGGDNHFVEQFSTNIPPRLWIDGSRNYPTAWHWRDGTLTAEGAGSRGFLYLHFSNWQSSRWTGVAAWKSLARLDSCPPGRPGPFSISAAGFQPL